MLRIRGYDHELGYACECEMPVNACELINVMVWDIRHDIALFVVN